MNVDAVDSTSNSLDLVLALISILIDLGRACISLTVHCHVMSFLVWHILLVLILNELLVRHVHLAISLLELVSLLITVIALCIILMSDSVFFWQASPASSENCSNTNSS